MILGLHVVDRLGRLLDDLQRVRLGEMLLPVERLLGGLPLEAFHDQVRQRAHHSLRVALHEARVVEGHQQRRLALEATDGLLVLRERRVHDLEGHLPVVSEVVGQEDGGGAADAELPADPDAGDRLVRVRLGRRLGRDPLGPRPRLRGRRLRGDPLGAGLDPRGHRGVQPEDLLGAARDDPHLIGREHTVGEHDLLDGLAGPGAGLIIEFGQHLGRLLMRQEAVLRGDGHEGHFEVRHEVPEILNPSPR
jgi:hypothetical protein